MSIILEKRFEVNKNKAYLYIFSNILDWEPPKMIVSQVKKIILLLTSLVLSIWLTIILTPFTFYMTLMKLIAILVIIYKLAHQKNSNYILFLIIIYLYLASIWMDAITLFNYFGILVLYIIFIRKLRDITTSSIIFIKKQALSNRLVG